MAVCGGAKSKQRQIQSRRRLPSLLRFHKSVMIFEVIELGWSLVVTLVDTTTRPWRIMLWFLLHLYFTALSILLTLFLRIVVSPFRLLNAARREKLLETQLQELQMHYEELGDKKSQLERRLEMATRDRKRIKESLDQAVAEWEKSIDRLKLLKSRVQELENQNAKLRELEEERKKLKLATKQQDPGNNTKEEEEQEDGNTFVDDSLLMEGRGVALASSIFSGVLSLLVGLISYEAEDPCMPLVIALFTVVVMSLGNVVQFFSKLQSRHGFDAVALLSFNWFMLGTLAFPAFPLIAKYLSPFTLQAGSWVASWFGIRF